MKTKSSHDSGGDHINPKYWMDILKLYRACLNNASELVKEAELLCNNGHYARAVALSILSIEEIGKSQIVADYTSGKVSRREFDDAFSKHEIKSSYNFRQFSLNNMTIEYDTSKGKKYHEARMDAFYVDYQGDYQPKEPKLLFSKEDARKAIDFVKKKLDYIAQMEMITERIGSDSFMK